MELHATPEELLALVEEMYPREFDRARAQLLIIKQRARIAELERLALPEEHHVHPHQHSDEGAP
jgi:hypothetical protein